MTKIMIYPLSYDTGFAPNPYGGILTFGCCMSKIRKNISEGDILIGIGSERLDNILSENDVTIKGLTNGKILYIAFITKKTSHNDYSKFVRTNMSSCIAIKIPSPENNSGDSIYEFDDDLVCKNKILVIPNLHLKKSWDDIETLRVRIGDDISEDVLLSTHYLYFGDSFPNNTIKQLDDIVEHNKNMCAIGEYISISISEQLSLSIHEYIKITIDVTNKCIIGNPCSSYAKLDLTQNRKIISM